MITGNAVWVILPEFLLLFGALTTYTFGRVGRQKGSWYTGGIATLFAIATLGVLISAIPAVQGGESLVVTLNPSGIALALTPLALFLGCTGTALLIISVVTPYGTWKAGRGEPKSTMPSSCSWQRESWESGLPKTCSTCTSSLN